MAPQAEAEFRNLSQGELLEAGLTYFRLYRGAEETIRRLEEVVKTLSNEVSSQNQGLLWAQEYLDQLKKMKFGPSTERRQEEGGPLFSGKPKPKEEYETVTRKKRTEFGRKEQPELPREEVLYTLSEDEQKAIGLRPMVGQFEESELIDVVPSRFVVKDIKRQKYCSTDSTDPKIVTAPGPLKLKDGSRYSLEFGVEVGVNKYQAHLPLHRQAGLMKSFGLDVDSQTLFSQVDTIAWYLKNSLMGLFRAQLTRHLVHLSDESPWGNLGKAPGTNQRFQLWAVRNEKCVLFSVYDSRSQESAKDFLSTIKGVLVTDGCPVYRTLASPSLVLANDWCHVRRKFVAAEKNFPAEAKYFIDQIRLIAEIEKRIKPLSRDERQKTRCEESKPIVLAIKEKLDGLSTILPQCSLGKGVSYTQNLWQGLTVFLDNPDVPFHTNDIERDLRSPVVGRKNHFGSHSLKTAEVGATWYSAVATCLMHDVDPRAYLIATLKKILTKQPIIPPWFCKPRDL